MLGLLGEGAAMYGIQGLWTAARYNIPVTFVICNNAQYQILKIGAKGLDLPRAKAGQFLGLDITAPEIDFVALARSLGVAAELVGSWFYGAAVWDRGATAIPLLSLELGLFLDYEVLP